MKEMKKEGPVGPNGEFQTYGNCRNCKTWGTIYLYGEIKGLCFHCVTPSKTTKFVRKVKGKITSRKLREKEK